MTLGAIVRIGIGAGAIHGFTMGLYAWLDRGGEGFVQCCLSAVKVPLVFAATGVITFPSLLVFSQLLAVPLRAAAAVRFAVTSMALACIVLASLSPVLAFFSLNTRSYPFLLLLNVLFFAIAGGIGLAQLHRRLVGAITEGGPAGAPTSTAGDDPAQVALPPGRPGPRKFRSDTNGAQMLRLWTVMYALVGCQTGWMLRPFVLAPEAPFELFAARGSHFFAAVLQALQHLFHG